MSIVDVSHVHHNRPRPNRERHYERRAAARAYEIYYILAVTAAFVMLLLCTIGMLVFVGTHSRDRAPAKDVCHDHQQVAGTTDLEAAAAESTTIQEESVGADSPEMIVTHISPLQHMLRRDLWDRPISEDDQHLLEQKIQQLATMEQSALVIGETIVPYEHREDLSEYVRTQIEASRIISKKEAAAILAMIHLNSSDLVFLHAQTGMLGRLKNSLTLTLCTQKSGNIHFMLVILQVEAHLGWKIIPMSGGERTSWNMAMKASLERKMRSETDKILSLAHKDSDSHADEQSSHDSLR